MKSKNRREKRWAFKEMEVMNYQWLLPRWKEKKTDAVEVLLWLNELKDERKNRPFLFLIFEMQASYVLFDRLCGNELLD